MAKKKSVAKPVTKQDIRIKMLQTCVWDAFGDHAGDEPDAEVIAESLQNYLEEEGFTIEEDQLNEVSELICKALGHESESEMADEKDEEERCYAERDEVMDEACELIQGFAGL